MSEHSGQLSDYPEPNTPKDMVEEPYWQPTKTTYQLWFCIPKGADVAAIEAAINGCSEEFKTPKFAPHVSIWSFSSPILPESDQEVLMSNTLKALRELPEAVALRDVDLKFGPMEIMSTWNQNILSVADDASNKLLGALNLRSQFLFPQHSLEFIPSDDPDFQEPAKRAHISFAYGEQDMPERQKILDWLLKNHPQVAKGVTVPSRGAHFSLVRTAGGRKSVWEAGIGAVEHWQEVARVPLDPSAPLQNGGQANSSALNLRLMMAEANQGDDEEDHQSNASVDEAGALDGM